MILLVDESVDRQVVDRLREDRYTVSYVAEMEPAISDEERLATLLIFQLILQRLCNPVDCVRLGHIRAGSQFLCPFDPPAF